MDNSPLSEKLRPKNFKEVLGQDKLLSDKSWLINSIKNDNPLSLLLYGPPGCGKTSIGRLYSQSFAGEHLFLSGADGTISQIKKIIQDAKNQPLLHSRIILFIDEIHRFNKAQQDIFLPYLENGTFILIAATTENPSFVMNNALLSRLRVITLHSLDESSLLGLLDQYSKKIGKIQLDDKIKEALINISSGDARHMLNCIENLEQLDHEKITIQDLQNLEAQKKMLYDRNADGHYQLISALHKSLRGSDPDAALYWFSRMLEGGEDPLYIVRRLIRMATEDIGLADPHALQISLNAHKAYQILGSPEGELAIAEAVLYLSLAPKSNSLYKAYKKAKERAFKTSHLSPPKIIVNAPTKWMKNEGFGKGYIYDHDTQLGFSGQNYFPDKMDRIDFYEPKEVGFEREMVKRCRYFQNLRAKLTKDCEKY